MFAWKHRLSVIGVSVLFCFSCAKNEHSDGPALLTWRQYNGDTMDDPREAIYILNGREIGHGDVGFLKVLEAIQGLPRKTELWVYPDKAVLEQNLSTEGSVEDAFPYDEEVLPYGKSTVPFRGNHTLMSELRKITQERDIAIWYLAAAPGKITTSSGDDLRMNDASLKGNVESTEERKRWGGSGADKNDRPRPVQ